MAKIKNRDMRTKLNDWLKNRVVNYKQVKALVFRVKWYEKEPANVAIWQGTLFGQWDFILLGIEKDGYCHS